MKAEAILKTAGYLTSTVSVICLGVVSWEGIKDRPLLVSVLWAGMGASVLGMLMRWGSYQWEARKTRGKESGSKPGR